MTELEKLVLTLQNNLEKGQKSTTLDTSYLLSVLQTAPDRASDSKTTPQMSPNIDGGTFSA